MSFLISTRRSRPGDDPIFALNAEARARALAGKVVLNATVGALLDDDGKLAVIQTVVDALRDLPPNAGAAYAPIAGNPQFLKAVVTDVFGESETREWTTAVATPGGSGALHIALANFLEPRQTALTTSFYWNPYWTLTDDLDQKLTTFRMFDDQGRLDVVDFDKKLTEIIDQQGRAFILLNSPGHNPTGYSFDADEMHLVAQVVARAAERAPIALALDIAYARYSATTLSSTIAPLLTLAGKAILLVAWSASKSFTQYGLRVGALIAVHPDAEQRREIQNALSYSCRGTWSNCNAGGMAAITRVLSDSALHARADAERALLKTLLDQRVARWNGLAKGAGLRFPHYDGGFFTTVFCDDPQAVAARLKRHDVYVVPISGGLRVALCSVAERDIERLVDALAREVVA